MAGWPPPCWEAALSTHVPSGDSRPWRQGPQRATILDLLAGRALQGGWPVPSCVTRVGGHQHLWVEAAGREYFCRALRPPYQVTKVPGSICMVRPWCPLQPGTHRLPAESPGALCTYLPSPPVSPTTEVASQRRPPAHRGLGHSISAFCLFHSLLISPFAITIIFISDGLIEI